MALSSTFRLNLRSIKGRASIPTLSGVLRICGASPRMSIDDLALLKRNMRSVRPERLLIGCGCGPLRFELATRGEEARTLAGDDG